MKYRYNLLSETKTKLDGKQIGFITVIGKSQDKGNYLLCQCQCGKRFTATYNNVNAGKVRTCGCSSLRVVPTEDIEDIRSRYEGRVSPAFGKKKKVGFNYGYRKG
jgi:hypothetical protein